MNRPEKNEYLELEILKHVEDSPQITNRVIASKLGCSVKLSHQLLKKMVSKGVLKIKKKHSRRWDYFLTPTGIKEKLRLTYEFLDFSMQFYHEARRRSSAVCKELSDIGLTTIAFAGAGELAEIAYLGIKEWDLELTGVYDDEINNFLGNAAKPLNKLSETDVDAILICMYDKEDPMKTKFLPNLVRSQSNMYWIF
ncbi:MAG: winged helix-turn-helix domain-containing protein [Verrucomicrobiota bacterium]|nr:winged helix-turn-helix domain-containing protein [Verrucomicrobiota bacterium]